MTGELEKLQEGNKSYLAQGSVKDFARARQETAAGQHPYAIVLTCSDSRVPPEHIFDAGIGEVFVVRNAGNVVDKIALGSIEYAAEHLHCPLLVVMGHESCGAVKAAWEAAEKPAAEGTEEHKHEDSIIFILKKLEKAVKKAKKKNKAVEDAATENVKLQIREIMKKSPLCKKLAEEGKLKIVGAKYKLSDGTVEIIQ
ncbi:Carbonic anhydrase [uncultured archaeon]|nr:Carbonic anhydrase [uncultured archaeon]